MKRHPSLGAGNKMIIGYYPIRGKAQVPRLLCEYLKLPYVNLLFNPKSWEDFKKTQKMDWMFEELPFLKDKQAVVCETYPISLYLIHKPDRADLLGQDEQDKIKIDIFMF